MEPVAGVRALETGVMRMVGNFSLNGPERIAVAEYVTGKTYDAAWQPKVVNQCAPGTWGSVAGQTSAAAGCGGECSG
jgi:hypothetical protein